MNKSIINTKDAPEAIGPYSQAIIHGDLIYTSGQLPLNPESMLISGQNAAEQTGQVMENMGAILKAAGSDYSKIIKCTIFTTDLSQFGSINEVYGSYFSGIFPVRTTVEVSRLPKDALVEIDCIAHL